MSDKGIVYVVEDDAAVRDSTVLYLIHKGWSVSAFETAERFLAEADRNTLGCVLLDIRMPGMSGLELQAVMNQQAFTLPIIFLTGHADVEQAVTALKCGAFDFLEKPYDHKDLHTKLADAIDAHRDRRVSEADRKVVETRIATLTQREQEVMRLMVRGLASKLIARELDISHRTVDVHRSNIMRKLEYSSLAELTAFLAKGGGLHY